MNCSFCSQPTVTTRTTMVVKSDGKVMYFCSTKCERNHNLGRSPKKVKWITKKQALK